jgi:4-aminobutyrate aminotransferase-like enzyme/Ser/Thr protein kinase RdoA (MazF antagonist)
MDISPPHFTKESAERIAAGSFGLVGSASPMVSERDQNFRIAGNDGRAFVLKISNLADDIGVIEMQTQAVLHVARTAPDLPVMRLVPSADGEWQCEVEAPTGSAHIVRMFAFMPGRHLQVQEMSLESVQELGAQSARLGQALRGFFHPSAGRALPWNARETMQLRPLLPYIEDTPRRRMVSAALDNFEQQVEPVFETLRAQTIHNDMSLSNILFDERHRVSGILDFGDLVHTALIADLVASGESMFERSDGMTALGAMVRGFGSVTPLERQEIRVLPDLLLARWATLVLMSAWRMARHPESSDYVAGWQAGAWTMFEKVDQIGVNDWRQQVRRIAGPAETAGRTYPAGASLESLVARRRRLFGSAISPLFYERPLHLVSGQGVWVHDAAGRAYLDAYNNVPVVGHSHPRVVEALARQAASLNTNTRYLHVAALELAERLIASMPAGLDTVMFVNSGSEANDLAWRLARTVTGGSGGVVTKFAYHGVSSAIADLSPEEWGRSQNPDHVALVPAPDGYRGPHRRDDPEWLSQYAAYVDKAVATLAGRGHRPAAMFVDTGFTSDGILTPPPGYLQDACQRWRRAGGLFVADEVQVGFGRSGSQLWGFQVQGLTPDVVTLGKPMGNGHPIAAVITRSDIVDRFAQETSWFSTFGGNPVACEAALAVLDVIEDQRLLAHTAEVGGLLRSRLDELQSRHQLIGEVRSRGLLVGVELVRDRSTREPAPAASVVNAMRERGVLVGSTGPQANVLKIRPPLVIAPGEVRLLADTLDQVLTELPEG